MEASDINPEPSVSPQEVINLFEAALKEPGWIDDKVADQFPRTSGKNASSMTLSDLNNGENRRNPNQGKKRGLSKSLGVHRSRPGASETAKGELNAED